MLLFQLIINGLIRGSIYALVALGFALIYRGARAFHIAHGGIYTTGAYALFSFAAVLNWSLPIAVFSALFITVIVGLISEEAVYYPFYKRKASSSVVIIASLGIYIFIANVIALFYGNETKIVFSGISKSYSAGDLIVTKMQVIQFIVAVLALTGTWLFLRRQRYGQMIKALANNPLLAEVLGMDIRNIRRLIFGLGSLLAGIAAILVASDVGIDPWVGMSMLLAGAVAMIVGGVDKWEGAILGGFLLGLIQAVAIWKFSARWQNTVTFIVLILFLLFRPQGILGEKKRLEEM